MKAPTMLRLLGSSNNERGDLFTRLMKDLFFGLGYDNLEMDIASSGREVDIQGEHRFELRRVIAECKAHTSAIGGADLNKFLGVLTRERKKHRPQPVAGYFISLGGFTGTAIQQEKESEQEGIVLFDSARVISELQRSRAIVSLPDAAQQAGRCAQANNVSGLQLDTSELLGHVDGYVWVLYFTSNKTQTHFALIHADGTPLSASVAGAITAADRRDHGVLHSLTFLAPPAPPPDAQALRAHALEQYRKWLGEECGYIQLDGLPADNDLSATKLKLEKLFVPLNVFFQVDKRVAIPSGEHDGESAVEPIGTLLGRSRHLALLATPGGGKSTLLKRLATAYSFPDRRNLIDDHLPENDWLPLYLRCRDLRDRAQRPLLELLCGIAAFANMDDVQASAFRSALSDALRSGGALLLVDGLDEISDEGARRAFAQNLRAFIAMFPQVALLVTSRIAGFRDVAGVIASICHTATLAPLSKADVTRLCVSWHIEVIADSPKIRADAAVLAATIWGNPHIQALVTNPLLLTTLLVVKRSNGEIPPNRAQLYQEAVRVLVRTWNVEGYAPLDESETLARLSYIACIMMQRGTQVIGYAALERVLTDATRELEAELQFAAVSPSDFIRRIEYRSSLLMQTGFQRIDELMQPVFEFRHLTFQEYLAARGFVMEQYPGRGSEQQLVDILAPHFHDERWQEVIPLAAVLAGRKSEVIVKRLIDDFTKCNNSEVEDTAIRVRKRRRGTRVKERELLREVDAQRNRSALLLGQCLLHEVTIGQTTLRTALQQVATNAAHRTAPIPIRSLAAGKFGKALREIVERAYFASAEGWSNLDWSFSEILYSDLVATREPSTLAAYVHDVLTQGDRDQRIRATLVLMYLAFESRRPGSSMKEDLSRYASIYYAELSRVLASNDLPSVQAACWALAWMGEAGLWPAPSRPDDLGLLVTIWRNSDIPELARKAAWAFAEHPVLPREAIPNRTWGECDEWLKQQANMGRDRRRAALLLGWYRQSPWGDAELVDELKDSRDEFASLSDFGYQATLRVMLSSLGDKGSKLLRQWARSNKMRTIEEG